MNSEDKMKLISKCLNNGDIKRNAIGGALTLVVIMAIVVAVAAMATGCVGSKSPRKWEENKFHKEKNFKPSSAPVKSSTKTKPARPIIKSKGKVY